MKRVAIKLKRQKGFTLLEVLIAITITALIGIGASQILSSAIRSNEQTQERLKALQALQKAMLLLSRDFQQLLPRSIRDEFGDFKPALISSNEDYAIEFSRTGWRNPLGDPRSDLQRVAYELRDDELIRHYWSVMDRSQDAEPIEWIMLKGVEEFTVKYMNDSGGWTDSWPPDETDAGNNSDDPMNKYNQIPKGLSFRLVHPSFGEITRIYDLPVYMSHIPLTNQGNGSDSDNQQDDSNTEPDTDQNQDEQDDGGDGSNQDEVSQ